MKLSEILSGPETWCRRPSVWRGTEKVARCILVALADALGFDPGGDSESQLLYERRKWLLRQLINERAGHRVGSITAWNDHDATWDDIAWVCSEFDRRRQLVGDDR